MGRGDRRERGREGVGLFGGCRVAGWDRFVEWGGEGSRVGRRHEGAKGRRGDWGDGAMGRWGARRRRAVGGGGEAAAVVVPHGRAPFSVLPVRAARVGSTRL